MAVPAALQAYNAYQQTMRQFLTLQEKVMLQFLHASQTGAAAPPMPVAMSERKLLPLHQPLPIPDYPNESGSANPSPALLPTSPRLSPPPQVSISPTIQQTAPATTLQPVADLTLPTSPVPVATLPQLERGSLTQTLLQLVSERTGYPIEMLGLEQDLEAELGIDSIKRVEILGAMQKSLPAAVAEGMQSQMESLTRVKSLKGIIEQVLSLLLPAGVGEAKDMGKS